MGTKTALTPADLFGMPGDDGVEYELSDGELITSGEAGARHERIKSNILTEIVGYRIRHPEARRVYSESLFQSGPGTARIPDVAFVGAAKDSLVPDADVVTSVVPDLAVEVISESETAAAAEIKVQEYLASGVREVWQFYSRERRVRIRTRPYGGSETTAIDTWIATNCPPNQ